MAQTQSSGGEAGNMLLEQRQIDELVERFYGHLTQEPAFVQMFAARNVDLAVLKERQKAFIARLAHREPLQEEHDEVAQVRGRHSFDVDPARAAVWIAKWEIAMRDMGLEADAIDVLMTKIRFLLDKMATRKDG